MLNAELPITCLIACVYRDTPATPSPLAHPFRWQWKNQLLTDWTTVNRILAERMLNADRLKGNEVKLASAYPVYVVILSWLADPSVPPTLIAEIT